MNMAALYVKLLIQMSYIDRRVFIWPPYRTQGSNALFSTLAYHQKNFRLPKRKITVMVLQENFKIYGEVFLLQNRLGILSVHFASTLIKLVFFISLRNWDQQWKSSFNFVLSTCNCLSSDLSLTHLDLIPPPLELCEALYSFDGIMVLLL